MQDLVFTICIQPVPYGRNLSVRQRKARLMAVFKAAVATGNQDVTLYRADTEVAAHWDAQAKRRSIDKCFSEPFPLSQ